MKENEDEGTVSLLKYCAKQIVYNWENKKYRSQIIKMLSTYLFASLCIIVVRVWIMSD